MALSKSGIVALLLNTTFFCLYKYSETRVTKLKPQNTGHIFSNVASR